MSYKFAQLRRSQLNNNDFLSPMSYELNDIITKPIVEKYNVVLPEKVKEITTFRTGKTKILSLELKKEIILF